MEPSLRTSLVRASKTAFLNCMIAIYAGAVYWGQIRYAPERLDTALTRGDHGRSYASGLADRTSARADLPGQPAARQAVRADRSEERVGDVLAGVRGVRRRISP